MKAPLPPNSIAEVPFSFGVRTEGESKLTSKVMLRYLEQLAELYWFRFRSLIIVLAILAAVVLLLLLRAMWNPSIGKDTW